MTDRDDKRQEIANALLDLQHGSLTKGARGLFAQLGYTSERTLRIASTKQFHAQLDPTGRLTERETESLNQLKNFHLLFQLTDAEFSLQQDLFDSGMEFEATQIHSYLFFAVEFPAGQYTRTTLSTIVRAINKPLPMPALVLFRYGEIVSIGIIHRRLNKRDRSRDVLEKVTLIKDIHCADPIRAHLEILNDFVFQNLNADFGVSNFVRLHEAWQTRLGSYALSNDFYREIADWYFWAQHQIADDTIKLPVDCDTEEEQSLFLIRLLTRVIFCWFLVEKRLIPATLFRTKTLIGLIKEFSPSKDAEKPDTSSTFYRAVLQNLFFGTLNMPPNQRSFREKKKGNERFDKNRGATNLWRYAEDFSDYDRKKNSSAAWLGFAERIPFLNGGLFDCLDEKFTKKEKKPNVILDGFSDNRNESCHLPNDLFFGPERTEDLSKDYGEEKKKTARSKRAKVRGLIEILARYKFTVEENTPLEEEIALDPELLGKVFENLLASYNEDTRTTARKALGAFYTPREIVNYMVDESLKSYLAGQVPRCKGVLEELFSIKATLKDIRPEVREALIAAIGNVKILDPACGSGAFPMGALHRLVDLLQKLDENNESWKRDRLDEAKRYRELLEEAGAGSPELSACDARIADIEKSFDTRFHALDFARKLYLIENCIYGIDIQPIATQIAKLRFFISLIVDQKIDQTATNLGVRPLPNLETRIVAADTLIPIQKDDGNLFSGDLEKLRKELAAIRHDHFNARTPEAKRKCRVADEAKRQEIAGVLEKEHTLPTESAQQLAAWDPYDQNAHAPFFDSEWMFGLPVGKVKVPGKGLATLAGRFPFVNELPGQMELIEAAEEESGFDIVIGNPPYVRQEKLRPIKGTLKQTFKCYSGSADLYVYFFEASIGLLKANGTFSFITSNKWFRYGYGKHLRAWLQEHTRILKLIDFGDAPVFTAIAYPSVTILQRIEKPLDDGWAFRAMNWEDGPPISSFKEVFERSNFEVPQAALVNSGWQLVSQEVRALLKRLRAIGTPLSEYAEGRLHNGVKSGLTKAYVIDSATKSRLIEEDPASADAIRPYFRGRNMRRWAVEPEGLWLLYIPWHFPLHDDSTITEVSAKAEREFRVSYPAIHAHLSQFKAELSRRDVTETGIRYEWYAQARPRFEIHEDFESPKVVLGRFMNKPTYAFDEDGYFHNDAQFFIGRAEPFLAGVLNSPCAWWFLKQTCTDLQGGYIQALRANQDPIPIPNSTDAQREAINLIVRWLVILTKQERSGESSDRDQLMFAYLERLLNGLIYELYFPDELSKTGIQLFTLLRDVSFPRITATSYTAGIVELREVFEDLYEGRHAIRTALDKLQTLDVVRVIEDKT